MLQVVSYGQVVPSFPGALLGRPFVPSSGGSGIFDGLLQTVCPEELR